ncbi:MAG TPA: choice-of-anchor J domain-containing protein, partial [Chitinophagaceae bacterium]
NVNIIPKLKRDLQVRSITPELQCLTTTYTPTATVFNNGTEAITGYRIAYRIGTGTPDTTTVTGVNIAPNTTATVALTTRTLPVGGSTITVYSFSPVTSSGTGDQNLSNDTLIKAVYVASSVSAPLVESFEGGTFVPSGWAVVNADASNTWQKAGTGFFSNGSAYMKNFGYLATGQKDAMFTPIINFTGVDSVKLTFDLSAAVKDVAAAAGDTLEVLVTKDCGNTFTTVYKKGGNELETIYDNTPVTTEYTPNAFYLWRRETINLSSFAPTGPIQLIFRNTNNNQNNVFVDNINLTTRTLPARLRAEGFMIAPNPFTERFNLWYVQAPSDLRYVTVYNAAGQLIWNRVFGTGSASNVITVDLTGKSAGFYIVHVGYSDKSKDQQIRIMKSN